MYKRQHQLRGNECEVLTLYKSLNQPEPGICLNLPLISTRSIYLNARHKYYKIFRGDLGDYQEREGFPPTWEPSSFIEKLYFNEDLVSDTGFLRLDKGNVVTINGCDGYALPTLLDRFDYQRPKK